MRAVLVISQDCEPCKEAQDLLAEYIQAGDVEVCEIDTCTIPGIEDIETVPMLVLIDSRGSLFAKIEAAEVE